MDLDTIIAPARARTPSRPDACGAIRGLGRGGAAWLVVLVLALFAMPATAQDIPQPSENFVYDGADLLAPAEEAALETKLRSSAAETGRPLVVVSIETLEGRTIEDVGLEIGRTWGLRGDGGADEGVILLIAEQDREMRIETGYDAEGYLPDILAGRIIRNTIRPAFRAGDFAGGIEAGTNEILASFALTPEEAAARAEQAAREDAEMAARPGGGGFGAMLMFMMAMFFFLSLARRGSGRRYRGGGKRGKKGKRRGRRGGFDAGDAAVLLWGIDAMTRASRGRRGGGFGGFGGGGGGGGLGGGLGGFLGGGGFGGGGASGGW